MSTRMLKNKMFANEWDKTETLKLTIELRI